MGYIVSIVKKSPGVGIDVPLCFTSPYKKGDISSPTDISCGDVKFKIPNYWDMNPKACWNWPMFHITTTAICVGDDLYPQELFKGDVKHSGTSIPSPVSSGYLRSTFWSWTSPEGIGWRWAGFRSHQHRQGLQLRDVLGSSFWVLSLWIQTIVMQYIY